MGGGEHALQAPHLSDTVLSLETYYYIWQNTTGWVGGGDGVKKITCAVLLPQEETDRH